MAKPNLEEKDILTPDEACKLWNLSTLKFRRFLKRMKGENFLAFYKTRSLILREAFEEYLKMNPKIREELTYGESRKR